MVFQKTDIAFFLSGGVSNTDINLSIGNAISNTNISTGLQNNLFPDVTPNQAISGITRYRCFYVRNINATQILQVPKLWIVTNTLSAFDEIDIALGSAAKNGTEPAIATETTAPGGGVIFTHPTSEVVSLDLPSLSPNDYKSIWARITVQSNANPIDNNATILRVKGTPL